MSDEDAAITRDTDTATTERSEELAPLFDSGRAQDYRSRWESLQIRFVDDPRSTVEEADALVKDLLDDLSSSFGKARSKLEEQWSEGEDASTEDLRLALRQYRSFFERLLAL
jgi:hypothetical protein